MSCHCFLRQSKLVTFIFSIFSLLEWECLSCPCPAVFWKETTCFTDTQTERNFSPGQPPLPSSDRCVVLFIHPTSVADWLLWARCWALWGAETQPLPTRSCCSDKGPHMASALEGSLRESGMGMERGTEPRQSLLSGGRRGSWNQ